MARYEQILGKISPIFYKLMQSRMLGLSNSVRLLDEYLAAKHLPNVPFVFDREEELRNAFYIIGIRPTDFFKYKRAFYAVELVTSNYAKAYWINADELIVILILNKFNFENEIIRDTTPPKTFKDLVKAFIGNGLYDAIRSSVK
ncbi:MAG: hypothetical protein RXR31_03155 [Thermoproteota archaeon]